MTTGVQKVDDHYLLSTREGLPDLVSGTYVKLEVHDSGCGMDEVLSIEFLTRSLQRSSQGEVLDSRPFKASCAGIKAR